MEVPPGLELHENEMRKDYLSWERFHMAVGRIMYAANSLVSDDRDTCRCAAISLRPEAVRVMR